MIFPRIYPPKRGQDGWAAAATAGDGERQTGRVLLRGGGRFVIGSRPGQQVVHPVVALVARILEERAVRMLHRDLCGLRSGESGWVLRRELVEQRVVIDA